MFYYHINALSIKMDIKYNPRLFKKISSHIDSSQLASNLYTTFYSITAFANIKYSFIAPEIHVWNIPQGKPEILI